MSKTHLKRMALNSPKGRKNRGRKRGFNLTSNTKNFLIGAAIALLPVSLYGYIKLLPPKLDPQVLTAKIEYHPTTVEFEKINITSFPTASITTVPTKAPVPVQKAKSTTPETTAAGPSEVMGLIERYSVEYGVNKDMMIHIAKCESGYRSNAVNGPYAGIYQFVSSTWSSNRRAMGLDPNPSLRFNAEESIKTAAFKMDRDGYGAWPACQAKARRLLGLSS